MEELSYQRRNWACIDLKATQSLVPSWPTGFPARPSESVPFVSVDGGLIDNEPFEYAHRGLLDQGQEHNPTEADTATKAVIMIDPFPELPDFELDDKLACDEALIFIIKRVFPLLKDQARFKPNEAARALDPTRYSRYLISPRRTADDTSLSSMALATSILGGFGGFMDIAFREHDYQLGRRNCQRFLKEHLAVGTRNPIGWNGHEPRSTAYADSKFRDDEGTHICIIPLCGSAAEKIETPDWPRISLKRLGIIEQRISERLELLVAKAFADGIAASIFRGVLQFVWRHIFGRDEVLKMVHWMIFAQLVQRDQLSECKNISSNARAIAVALSSSKYDYWSDDGLAKLIAGTTNSVSEALGELRNTGLNIWSGQVERKSCHVWAKKRPGWLTRNIPGWSGPPTIG
jgi:hypothetical protein